MEIVVKSLYVIIYAVFAVSVVVMVIGFLICIKDMLKIAFTKGDRIKKDEMFKLARLDLGGYILMGLEIMIIADILETLVHPSIDYFIKLFVIVVIRTTLAYFLNKEIEHLEHSTHK